MKAYCYISYSQQADKYYIGFTQDSIENRLEKHNNGSYANSYTVSYNDWEIFFFIECSSIKQALNIEKHIKKMKSKKYIENLKNYPEISHKLLEKYNDT